MTARAGFTCRSCGQWHDDLPFAFHAEAPTYWSPELAADDRNELTSDQCVIDEEHFFVRGLIRLPVADADQDFEWGVWASLSQDNFLRMSESWHQEGREADPPMFAWLSSELAIYEPSTLNLKTTVHTQPVGLRPVVELEATDHPLAIEQREGITMDRVQQLAEQLLHES